MIQVRIKNVASLQYTHGAKFDSQVEAQTWIDSQLSVGLNCAWGKPEHTIQVETSPYVPAEYESQEVLIKEAVLDEEGNELEPAEYELQNVMISPAVEAVYEDQIVPSEFEIEIVDLMQDYEWLLSECMNKRKTEYPSPEEFMNAFFDGSEQELEEMNFKRLAIKSKYPKP